MTPPHTIERVGQTVVEKEGKKVISRKDLDHVRRGYKATLSRENTSPEAKKHAREMLRELASDSEEEQSEGEEESKAASKSKSSSSNKPRKQPHEHDPHRVIGGLKAALKNPHVKEEHKGEIKARLEELQEEWE